jgi:Flp pilus assembly protein TadG
MKKNLRSKKGQVLILFAFVLVVLLALVGFAIDLGMAYLVQVKLNASVDAAAIAAGRVVSQGASAISTEATNFFQANYPAGLLGANVQAPSTNAVHNADGSWSITVTATALSPTYFAKVAGLRNFSVEANATSYVRTLDLILVMDCSGSIGADLGALQSAAINFIKNFDVSTDRVGLIHFAGGAVTDVSITTARGFNTTTISNAINGFRATGATTSEEALRMAKAQLDAIPATSQSSLRAIVLFTDGAPNGVAGTFINGHTAVTGDLYSETSSGGAPYRMFSINRQDNQMGSYNSIASLPTTDYTGTVNLSSYNNIRLFGYSNTRCNVNSAARNMLENVANAARSETGNPIHIFTIGLGDALTTLEIQFCGYGSNETGANILKRLANIPGVDTYNQNQPEGVYAYAADATQLNGAFNQIVSALLRISK